LHANSAHFLSRQSCKRRRPDYAVICETIILSWFLTIR